MLFSIYLYIYQITQNGRNVLERQMTKPRRNLKYVLETCKQLALSITIKIIDRTYRVSSWNPCNVSKQRLALSLHLEWCELMSSVFSNVSALNTTLDFLLLYFKRYTAPYITVSRIKFSCENTLYHDHTMSSNRFQFKILRLTRAMDRNRGSPRLKTNQLFKKYMT